MKSYFVVLRCSRGFHSAAHEDTRLVILLDFDGTVVPDTDLREHKSEVHNLFGDVRGSNNIGFCRAEGDDLLQSR